MKKFLFSFGVLALAGASILLTSCKDEDVLAATISANVNTTQAATAAATSQAAANGQALTDAAAAATPTGGSTVNNGDGSITVKDATGATVATVTQTTDATTGDVVTTTIDAATGTKTETVVTTSYTYTVNGVPCADAAAVQAALATLPAGSTATVVATLVQTTTVTEVAADGTKGEPTVTETTKDKTSTVEIPEVGKTSKSTIDLPTSVVEGVDTTAPVDITVTTVENGKHSGGSIE